MKSAYLCALFAILALSACVVASEVVDVSSTLEGVWSVQVARTSAEQKFAELVEAPVNLVANFSRRDGHLVAAITSSDGEVNVMVQLTTDGPLGGSFYLLGGSSSDEEFDAGSHLFQFDLKNNTERTLIGAGNWVGTGSASAGLLSKPGVYQVTVTDRNLFVFNVYTQDGAELVTVTGSKLATTDDQAWYTKFGTPLLFIGAMAISRIVRSFTKPAEQAPAAGAKATAAAAKKKD